LRRIDSFISQTPSTPEKLQEEMEECDTLMMVGTSFLYIEFLHKLG
jgi:hypothetical protein